MKTRILILGVLAACGHPQQTPIPSDLTEPAARGEWAFWASDLGSAAFGSVPVAVFWAVLDADPSHFPPGNLDVVGLNRKPLPYDDGLPVGFVRTRRMGLDLAASNCALCHVGRVARGMPLVAGLANKDFDIQGMLAATRATLLRDDFTIDTVTASAIARGDPQSFLQRMLLRGWLWLAKRKSRQSTLTYTHETGPGRSDAVNGWKRVLKVPQDGALSYVDTPVIYNQKLKTLTLFDGSISGDASARVMLTELQKGRSGEDLLANRAVFDDMLAFLSQRIAPPRYPNPIDAALAKRGQSVFQEECSDCHGEYGDARTYPNKRVATSKVGTDPNRALAMNQGLREALGKSAFAALLKIDPSDRYMPPPLDGIWASAPYLHNGSVPTLADMFVEPADRPRRFVRRANAFDPIKVGLVCIADGDHGCGPDEEQKRLDPNGTLLFVFDTTKPGNSNKGHPFTVELNASDKPAVLEYLKTL